MRRIVVAFLFAVLPSCASAVWDKDLRRQAQHTHAKQVYALTHSYYFSQLYDDNERWLLSERPSKEVSHRVNLAGLAIHPPPAEGILPAGTQVVLERIEFPTRTAVMHRMLNSPVHHIWLRLRPAPGALLPLPRNDRPFVLVLPTDIDTPQQLAAALHERLADVHTVAAWLDGLKPNLRAGVQTKQVTRGMDQQALEAAAGAPTEWRTLGQVAGRDTKIARYADEEAWMVDGVVTEIHPAETREGRAP